MHKNATKCNKTQSKWCINKHGASKIIDSLRRIRGQGTSIVAMLAATSVEPSVAVSLPPVTGAQVLRAELASVGEVFSSTAAVIAAPAVVY
jgi:hypothetical protein